MSHNTSSLVPWIASFTDSFSAAGASTLTLTGFGLSLGTDVDLGTLGTETGRAYTATDGDGNGNLVISLTVAALPDPVATVQVKVLTGGVPAVQSPLSVQHGQFNPTSIASLVVWYDAGDVSTITYDASDYDRVAQWDDKSGNGLHATQTTTNKKPQYHASGGGIGQAHIRWGRWGDYMLMDIPSSNYAGLSSAGYRNSSYFFVFNSVSAGGGNWSDLVRGASHTSGETVSLGYNSDDSDGLKMWASSGWQCTGGTATSSLPSKVLGGWFWTDAGFKTRVNGAADVSDTTLTATSGQTDALILGGQKASYKTDFEISEILIFNTELTGSDLSDVEDYLNTKWSIY